MPGWGLESLGEVLGRKRVLVPLQGQQKDGKGGVEEETKVLVYVKAVGSVETCMSLSSIYPSYRNWKLMHSHKI